MRRHAFHAPLLAAVLFLLAGALPALDLPALRVLAPAAGAELSGGDLTALEWEAPAGLGAAEEWEAFLSLDGGVTYPVRLTPHLDLSIRRLLFRVPDLPTRRARLLLRYGDERREREIEAAGVFTIAARSGWREELPVGRVQGLSHGEAARPGDHGVVLWVEGTRAHGE